MNELAKNLVLRRCPSARVPQSSGALSWPRKHETREDHMAHTLSRILAPTDFSTASDEALAYGKMLGDRLDASLLVLHVIEQPEIAGTWGAESYTAELPRIREAATRAAEDRLSRLSRAHRDVSRCQPRSWTVVPRERLWGRASTACRSHRHGHSWPERHGPFAIGKRHRESPPHGALPGAGRESESSDDRAAR